MNDGSDRHLHWRAMRAKDLNAVCSIADAQHPGLRERVEIFAEKLHLFPEGCFVLKRQEEIHGYAFAHPWMRGRAPKLDTFLCKLPASPDALFLHDVAISPDGRGANAIARLMAMLRDIAIKNNFTHLTLVSVYGTDAMWRRYAFHDDQAEDVDALNRHYGANAKYMSSAIT